jgi:KDO2-lipid IV(A) lauroyltransferase
MQQILLIIIRHTPLALLYLLAWLIGQVLYLLHNKQRHIAEVNLALCFPDWSPQQRQELVRQSLVETSKTLLESLKLWSANSKKILRLVRQVEGEALLEQALASNKGALLITPHLGNWEVVNLYCSARHPMTSMYRTQKSKFMDQLMRNGREQFGARLVPATRQGIRPQLEALHHNELVMILPDQNPSKGMQLFVPFFNVPTNTPVLPIRLAQKTGTSIILAYAERLPLGRGYRLVFEKVSDDLYHDDLETAVTAMNRELENLIRNKPQQYWWGYSRFRHRPEGEAKLYKKD